MAATFIEIAQLAMQLPQEQRARLAEMLLETLSTPMLPDIENAWNREVARRVRLHEILGMEELAAEDVFTEAKCMLR